MNVMLTRYQSHSRVEEAAPAVSCRNLWKIYGGDGAAHRQIIADNLSRDEAQRYGGAFAAIRDVSFDVRRGEVFCVMGLSGSGKSTLLRHVNRLIEPSAGSVSVDGVNILATSAKELRRLRSQTIGMVFQNVGLLPHKTVRYNVAYGLKVQGKTAAERDRIAEEKLALVHLAGWADRYPSELSGGMQQRIGLARALASNPSILLLDEPFSALDPLIRGQLQDEFLRLIRGSDKTAIFITHDFDEALKIGDRIAIMKDGEFVQIGTPRDITLNPVDDYVAQFVRSGAIGFLAAKSVMRPLDQSVARAGRSDVRTINQSVGIEALARELMASDSELVVVDDAGNPLGLLSKDDVIGALASNGRSRRQTMCEAER